MAVRPKQTETAEAAGKDRVKAETTATSSPSTEMLDLKNAGTVVFGKKKTWRN